MELWIVTSFRGEYGEVETWAFDSPDKAALRFKCVVAAVRDENMHNAEFEVLYSSPTTFRAHDGVGGVEVKITQTVVYQTQKGEMK